ncbi:PqqD family peptide modification chaperone [Tistrella mobilis]|uniref:PqqD family protein n=1 Tax=Tistrella mobilis TaxID=171437 RepID=UPI0035571120
MPSIYRFTPDVLEVEVESDVMLLDYASGKYFGLTGAVSRLTAPLRDGASLDEMVAHVTDYYDVTEVDARVDLARILAELQAAGLVVAAEA